MGTVPEPIEIEENETAAEKAEEIIRSVIAGHPQGAVRRMVLYLVLGVTTIAGIYIDGPGGLGLAIASMITILLLSMTDRLL